MTTDANENSKHDQTAELASIDVLSACSKDECICSGNWRELVGAMERKFGALYTDTNGKVWRFAGLLHADDDSYYCMTRNGKAQFLSCVGSIEGFGFTAQDNKIVSVNQGKT